MGPVGCNDYPLKGCHRIVQFSDSLVDCGGGMFGIRMLSFQLATIDRRRLLYSELDFPKSMNNIISLALFHNEVMMKTTVK
jgi:hypothetical protein